MGIKTFRDNKRLVFLFLLIFSSISASSSVDIIPKLPDLKNLPSWSVDSFSLWLWGPDGTVTVQSVNQTEIEEVLSEDKSVLDKLKDLVKEPINSTIAYNIEPIWSRYSLNFPILNGMEGVLVRAEPFDGCEPIDAPPESPTEDEQNIEDIAVGNITKSTKWFVIVGEGNCDRATKIKNSNEAGYDIVILLSLNSTSETETTDEEKEFKIFPCITSIKDGMSLMEKYSYPKPFVALVKDLRNFHWTYAIYKVIGIVVGLIFIISGIIYAIKKFIDSKRRKSREKRDQEMIEALYKIVDKLPSHIWEENQLTKDEKCQICQHYFQKYDLLRSLPCYHRFHHKCIINRINNKSSDCGVCNYQLIPPERKKSSESTPLLPSYK